MISSYKPNEYRVALGMAMPALATSFLCTDHALFFAIIMMQMLGIYDMVYRHYRNGVLNLPFIFINLLNYVGGLILFLLAYGSYYLLLMAVVGV